ncbi:toll/interleukin-1 receptor domain-containing protein [Desulfobulbus propionicus]
MNCRQPACLLEARHVAKHEFISSSRESKDVVKILVEDLDELGYRVWFDHAMTGGQLWWKQILVEIRGCDLFVIVLSFHLLG